MSQDIQGVIEKMHTKSGTGKRGAWTKYSAVINGGWVNFGFDNPGYKEGDEVKVRCTEDQYGLQVGEHKLVAAGSVDKPADTPGNASSGGSSNHNLGMAWGNAGNIAASLIVTLKDVDGLPLTAATGKANKAKRFDEVMEIFDKLRVKLYNDSLDINRVLDEVADFGAIQDNTPPALPNGELPTDDDDDIAEGDLDDDIPF
jgi:hypothetical protein